LVEAFHGNESYHKKKTRVFFKIQEGCNAFCTYCIIPYGRGPARSLSLEQVLKKIDVLVKAGVKEIVFTGTNIGKYGEDLERKVTLEELVDHVLKKTSLERLRLSSLDPTEISDHLLQLMAENQRLCPHIHVSLQSTQNKILRLMKRKYDFVAIENCLMKIEKLKLSYPLMGGVFVGMDLITGFPGETREDFLSEVKVLETLPWHRLHVFPYSERSNTPATRLPDKVSSKEKKERSVALNALSLKRLNTYGKKLLEQKGFFDSVLLENTKKEGWILGHTPNYFKVLIEKKEFSLQKDLKPNQIVKAVPLELVMDSKAQDMAFISKLRQV
jgi:threonylcarbamoyladenosine tRNA methylthiotransferase MtaB